ncbi:hypothetical protein E2C01_030322 [Portunus trituberculatus]|uniref:Uncharacterized protein n=1 Tax=Portunus trituberculatus TaxID=210409 RepID=A0A5B7ETY3_PORTR|nr:hypothetical protein [Portunus trituberculatus]
MARGSVLARLRMNEAGVHDLRRGYDWNSNLRLHNILRRLWQYVIHRGSLMMHEAPKEVVSEKGGEFFLYSEWRHKEKKKEKDEEVGRIVNKDRGRVKRIKRKNLQRIMRKRL